MKISDEKELPVSQDKAWAALNDTELLKACIPGCESITLKEDGQYEVLITAAVGPVKAKFRGHMEMKDVVAPVSYTLVFSGQGGAAGYGRGEARVLLKPLSESETILQYSAEASVGGKLAQIGSRLVDMAAQKMATDFFGAFLVELNRRHPVAVSVAAATPHEVIEAPTPANERGFWATVFSWIGRLFGRSKPQGSKGAHT